MPLILPEQSCVSKKALPNIFDTDAYFSVFIRTKDYDLLSGILLAITGCEAMFAK